MIDAPFPEGHPCTASVCLSSSDRDYRPGAFLGILHLCAHRSRNRRLSPRNCILRNGLIYTVDSTNTLTEAVAIRGGKIVFVGSNKDVKKYQGKQTRVIDLKGAFVLPGFNDNHVHFASAAQFLEFNIMRAATQQEFVARVREVVARLPKGEWILGGYWGAYDQWAAGSAGGGRREPFSPDMREVEAITKDHPMFIRKFDDSEFAANTAALRAVGIDPADPKLPPPAELQRGRDKTAGNRAGRIEDRRRRVPA